MLPFSPISSTPSPGHSPQLSQGTACGFNRSCEDNVEQIAVANDQTQVDEPGRSRVAGPDDNVVRYLTEKYGLKRRWVQNLIVHHGKDRKRLEQAARELMGT